MMSIIFAGDSITEEWDLSSILGAVNKGVGGDTPDGLAARFQADVLSLNPWAVHILIGTNAVANEAQMVQSAATVRDLALQAQAAHIKLIVGKIPPREWNVSTFNNALAGYASTYGLDIVDYWTPLANASGGPNEWLFKGILPYTLRPLQSAGLGNPHPNTAGHTIMTEIAKQAINRLREKAAITVRTLCLSQ